MVQFSSDTGQSAGGLTTYDTVAAAEAATGADNDLCYVVETDTIYRYEAAGSDFTDDNEYVLSTGDAGDTRWLGVSGQFNITGAGSPFLQRVDTGAWEMPVDDVEYYNGFKDGAQAYYLQHTVVIGSAGQTVINSDFYTNGYELYSWRFFAVNDATPATKYAIPKDGINPSFTVPAVSNSNGLSITRTGTGVYPGWSYIGGYTYFK